MLHGSPRHLAGSALILFVRALHSGGNTQGTALCRRCIDFAKKARFRLRGCIILAVVRRTAPKELRGRHFFIRRRILEANLLKFVLQTSQKRFGAFIPAKDTLIKASPGTLAAPSKKKVAVL